MKNRAKTSTRKPAVSTQNQFGDLPSSRNASPRRTMHFEILGVFRALMGTIFVPILLPNMSGAILAVRFLPPSPRPSKENPDESCVMMHHGWSCIIHDHESCISDDHESLWNHQWLCIIMHHGSIMDMHHAWSLISSNHGFSFDGLGGGLEARTDEKLPFVWHSTTSKECLQLNDEQTQFLKIRNAC